MTRPALKPHMMCGATPLLSGAQRRIEAQETRRFSIAIRPVLLVALMAVSVVGLSPTRPAWAQDPSLRNQPLAPNKSFPNAPGGIFGAPAKVNSALPLNMQADQLVYDTKGKRIIARGNVEIF